MKRVFLPLLAAGTVSAVLSAGELADLRAEYRDNQLFLQWRENNLSKEARLTVWRSTAPITRENLKSAECIADLLNPGSARDWWQDIDSFYIRKGNDKKSEEIFAGDVAEAGAQKKTIPGFVIKENGKPLDPRSGLHVHTPEKPGTFHYAVSWKKGFHGAPEQLLPLAAPVTVTAPGKAAPIRISGRKLAAGCAKGLPLIVQLHGRGGGAGVDSKGRARGTHLIFLDRSLGWREGLPVKFNLSLRKDCLQMELFDRVWIGRVMKGKEVADARDKVPAISTFWLGYNVNIGESNLGPEFRVDNYSERIILHLIRWAQEYLGTDPARTYAVGGSMGGSGAVQLATHFPDVFAAVRADVPVYSYTWLRSNRIAPSAIRLVCSCGPFSAKNPARLPDGRDLLDYGSGAKNIARPEIDMPPIFATNGRNDWSIPWGNNPPFYRAANEARQAFQVFWNGGDHGMTRACPKDMRPSNQELFRYRLDRCFVAFSNSSDNKDYGDGDSKKGDTVGWINRGLSFSEVKETPNRCEVTLRAAHPEMRYPVHADVTLRRRQQFRPAPGSTIQVTVNGKTTAMRVPDGPLTIPGIVFADSKPVTLLLEQ